MLSLHCPVSMHEYKGSRSPVACSAEFADADGCCLSAEESCELGAQAQKLVTYWKQLTNLQRSYVHVRSMSLYARAKGSSCGGDASGAWLRSPQKGIIKPVHPYCCKDTLIVCRGERRAGDTGPEIGNIAGSSQQRCCWPAVQRTVRDCLLVQWATAVEGSPREPGRTAGGQPALCGSGTCRQHPAGLLFCSVLHA